jgi:hypothetical protein
MWAVMFLIGLFVGTTFGFLARGIKMLDDRPQWEQKGYIKGKRDGYYERMKQEGGLNGI